MKQRTRLVNQLHEQLCIAYPSYKSFFNDISRPTALYFWEHYPSRKYLRGKSVEDLRKELVPVSHNKCSTKTREKILDAVASDKVKNIDKDVHIYFVGSTDDDANLDIAKQYKKANERIVAEAVDINNRPDLAQKYGIESGTQGIIVECGEKSKVLTSSDLVTYDTTTYETINIAEEKLTSSILSVTSNKVPKVYFLEGYSEFSLDKNMNYLKTFLSNAKQNRILSFFIQYTVPQSSFITVIAVIQIATETAPCPIISKGKVSMGFKSDDIIIRIF